MTFLEQCYQDFSREFFDKEDKVIYNAFVNAGLDPKKKECLTDITIVSQRGDNFEHYYYKHGTPEEKRIISIETNPTIVLDNDGSGKVIFKADKKYY